MRKGFLFALALLAIVALAASGAYAATCTPTGFYKDGINLTAAVVNPSGAYSSTLDSTGCNIGVYYWPGATGTVDGADISGANYFGVLVAGDCGAGAPSCTPGATSVDVENSTVSDIHDLPSLDGAQHGSGIAYYDYSLSGSASGTASRNTVSDYQKGGIVVLGTGASVSVSDNTVTGIGPTSAIAQNGIEFDFGAAVVDLSGNDVSGNIFTQNPSGGPYTPYVSTGILLYEASSFSGEPVGMSDQGKIASTNHAFDNQSNVTIIQ